MLKQLLFITHSAIFALAVMFAVADRAAEAVELKQRVLYNLDGHSCMYTKADGDVPTEITVEDLERLIDEIAYDGSQVNTLLVGIGSRATYYPTEVGTMYGTQCTPEQQANWPSFAQQWYANMNGFYGTGIDPYAVILAEAKQQGLESMLTFRMNDVHNLDFLEPEFWTDNPGYRLGYGLDFGHEAVRDYTFNLIQEAVQRYDSDGIELDFNRSPTFFQAGTTTEERIEKINSVVQRVRTLLDVEGARRGKHLILTARVPSNYGSTPPTYETSRAIGCDPVAWAQNGWIDYLTVSEYLYERGTLPIESWKEQITEVPVYGGIEAVMPGGAHLTPEQYRVAAQNLWEKGADGVYLFNFFTPRQIGNEPPFEVLKDLGAPPEPPTVQSVDLSGSFNADTIGVATTDAGGIGYYDPAEDFKFVDFGPVAGFTLGSVGDNGADSPNTVLMDLGGSYDPELGNQAPISATIDVNDARWSDFSVLHSGFRDNPTADAVITITYTDATTQEFTNWQIVSDGGISWAGTAGDATTAAITDRYRVDPATGLLSGGVISKQTFLGLDDSKLVDTITFDITGIDADGIAQVGVYAVSYTPVVVAGDADRNGVVDAADAAILALNWQSTNANWAMGDFNDDNVVNDVDAALLATNWHFDIGATASVPEPSALILLALGCFVLRSVTAR